MIESRGAAAANAERAWMRYAVVDTLQGLWHKDPQTGPALEVSCTSCNRTFVLDDKRAQKAVVARCVCGARVRLLTARGDPATGPHRLGKYVLLQRLAVGGMGEIYYGKMAGVEGFQREVAIKRMLPHLSADRAFVDMMIKEAKLTVLLHHPNIVQVYDLAKEGNDYYIAMEYVPGVTVSHLLEEAHSTGEHLPVAVAVHVAMQVLRGLGYAHDLKTQDGEAMQILHRDITPQNILVTRGAWVKITDFGIAKARNEISTTSPGMIKGKIGYLAPEQIAGQNPDHRADLFCCAIILWESLAGRRLFKAADEISTFRMIAEAEIPPLAEFRSGVPREIEEVVRTGLARLPDNRFKSADQFCDALNQALFPSTADENADDAKKYFNDHPEMFAAVDNVGRDTAQFATDANHTVAVPGPSERLTDITNLSIGADRGRGLRTLLIAAGAVLFLVAALGIWLAPRVLPRLSESQTKPTGHEVQTPGSAPLTVDEVQLAVDGEAARFAPCAASLPPALRKLDQVALRLVIASTGGVAELATTPPLVELAKAGACIDRTVRALRFRAHPTPSFTANVVVPLPKRAVATEPPPDAGAKLALGAGDIQAELKRNTGAILNCLSAFKGDGSAPSQIVAVASINTSGKIVDVDFEPPLSNDAVAGCLRRAFRAFKLGRKPKAEMSVKIPLTIKTL
ncbi:MAG: serine/threonine protein kinase [Deltaproteobacteria bacterium]|nr:serine/threonine protein kinase [Deltaproteobacteria bacterium]